MKAPFAGIVLFLILTAPSGAAEWSFGVDVPLHKGTPSLWRTGQKWAFGFGLGGPVYDIYEGHLHSVAGSFTAARFSGSVFYFGELGVGALLTDEHYQRNGGGYNVRAGVGISRRYKDLRVFVSYGIGYEGWDGDGITSRAGMDQNPRIVVCLVL